MKKAVFALVLLLTFSFQVPFVYAENELKSQGAAVQWAESHIGKGSYTCAEFAQIYMNTFDHGRLPEDWWYCGGVHGPVDWKEQEYPADVGWQRIQTTNQNDIKPGDIIIFTGPSKYGHTGIALDSKTMIDANGNSGDYEYSESAPAKHNISNLSKFLWGVLRPPFYVSNAENIGNNFEGMIRVSDQWLTNSNGVAKLTPNDSFDLSYTFRFELRPDGTYKVTSKKDGKCLGVYGGTSNEGGKLGFYASDDSDAQRIRFENFKEGYAIGVQCSPNNVIDAGGVQGNFGDGSRLWMWGRNDTPPQWFQIFRDETRSFNGKQIVIKSVAANKYLSVWDDVLRSLYARVNNYDTAVGSWEILTAKVADDGWAGLFSSCAGKYLTTNINKNEAPLEAAATSMQSWEVYKIYKSWDVYYLKSQANGKWVTAVLDQSNVPLKARSDYPGFWEKFKIEEPVKGLAEGTYRIINGSGRSLSVLTGSNTANPKSTDNVCLYDYDSRDPAQRWTLRRVGDNLFEIQTPNNNVILNPYSDYPKHGTKVNVYGNEGSDTQRWFIEQSGDKFIIRLQSNRNLVLTATGSGNADAVNVSNYDSNNNNQKWSFNKL
ncbi:MAG: RICIN domain-containing protein [Clostridiales bacterium]|jgi:hypothetical protein|nr:RICIN domain-containing protein [Clostridiales bacterium]